MQTADTYRLKVPALFWDDHADRKPCDGDPAEYIAREVGRCGKRVCIEATPLQLATLQFDAVFYTHPDGPGADDPAYRSLRRSAAATLAAINAVEG